MCTDKSMFGIDGTCYKVEFSGVKKLFTVSDLFVTGDSMKGKNSVTGKNVQRILSGCDKLIEIAYEINGSNNSANSRKKLKKLKNCGLAFPNWIASTCNKLRKLKLIQLRLTFILSVN